MSRKGRNRQRAQAWQGRGNRVSTAMDVAVMHAAGPRKLPDDPVVGTTANVITSNLYGLTPTRLSTYFNEFYNGRFANIARVWEVMENRDDTLSPIKHDKRFGKIKKELDNYEIIIPGYDTMDAATKRQAEKHAALLEQVHSTLRSQHGVKKWIKGGRDLASEFILEAALQQYSLVAKVWERTGAGLCLTLKHVPLYYFRVDKDGELVFSPNGTDELPVHEDEWIVAARSRAIMEAVAVLVLFKRLPMRQLVRILEKWGIPNVHGESPAKKGSPEWTNLYNAVRAYQSDMAAVISDGNKIVKDESGFRSANLHRPFIDLMNRLITINLVGGDLGSMAQAGTGTLAGGAQAEDTDDIIAADVKWFRETINTQVDDQAVYIEFGDEVALANYYAAKPDREDDTLALNVVRTGVNLGARISRDYYHDRFSVPEAGEGEDILEVVNPYDALTDGAQDDAEGTEDSATKANSAPQRRQVRVANSSQRMARYLRRQQTTRAHSAPVAPPARAQLPRAHASPRGVKAALADLDQLEANALQPVRSAYAAVWQPLIDAIAEAPNLTAAESLARDFRPDLDAFNEVMGQTLFAAAMRGFVPMRSEIAVANSATPGLMSRIRGLVGRKHATEASVEYGPLPFKEAEEFWENKQLIVDPGTIIAPTWEDAMALGFKVGGITEETVLRQIWELIDDAITGEKTIDELIKILTEKFGLDSAHAENVLRTNMQSAYQWGHYQQLINPDVLAAFPIWGFDVTLDEGTSEICEPLAGQAYPASDSVWDAFYPPNHFQCRTQVFPLADGEAADFGFSMGSGWPVYRQDSEKHRMGEQVRPLGGFDRNIGKAKLSEVAG